MSHCRSDIKHEDLISINNFIIDSLETFLHTNQYSHMQVVFQYLEHLQGSNYNFINVNSITNDEENYIYLFKINKTYYQFNQLDYGSMQISARSLLLTMKNTLEFLKAVENKANNYSFSYIVELIQCGFNNIIKKLVNLHKFAKIIERKPIYLVDAIMFFNNVVCVFNDKFEILKTFMCVDNVMFIYYFDVDRDFEKILVTKIHIPQLRLDTNLRLEAKQCNVPISNIFSPAYASFFNDRGNTLETSCDHIPIYNCNTNHTHGCDTNHTHGCDTNHTHGCDTNHTHGCDTNHTHGCDTNHMHNSDLCLSHHVHSTELGIRPRHFSNVSDCDEYVCDVCDTYEHVDRCDYTYVYDPDTCRHTHHYNPLDNTHTHTYENGLCKHTIIYDPTLCIHTHVYNPAICRHRYVYDDYHCYKDISENDISHCPYTIIYDVSQCVYTYTNTCEQHSHKYVSPGCDYQITYDEENLSHLIQYSPSLCDHSIAYDCSTCIHTYDNDVAKHVVVTNIDASAYLVDVSNYIYTYEYDSSLCKMTANVNRVYISYSESNSTTYIDDMIQDSSLCIVYSTFDPSYCSFSSTDNYVYTDTLEVGVNTFIYDPSLCQMSQSTINSYEQTISIDTSFNDVTIIIDPSLCQIVDNSNTYVNINHDIYNSTHCMGDILYYSDTVNKSQTDDECTCSQIHTYDMSGCSYSVKHNIITSVHTIRFDSSLCKFTEYIEGEDTHVLTYIDIENKIQITYDATNCIVNRTFDISHNQYVHKISVIHNTCVETNIISDSIGLLSVDCSNCKILTKYNEQYCTTLIRVDLSNATVDICNNQYNINGVMTYSILVDPSSTIINVLYNNIQIFVFTSPNTPVYINKTNTLLYTFDQIDIDASGCNIVMQYDISSCTCIASIDPSLCDVSENTFTGLTYTFDLSGSLDISNNVYTYISNGVSSINIIHDFLKNHITSIDASGLQLLTTYDSSLCTHILTVDPSLCTVDISGTYTFETNKCTHIVEYDDIIIIDISANVYKFIIYNDTDISINNFSEDTVINTFEGGNCTVQITTIDNGMFNTDQCTHEITFDPSLVPFSTFDISGNITFRYDVSDSYYEIVLDPLTCTYVLNNGHHTIIAPYGTIKTISQPDNMIITHCHNVPGTYCTFLRNVSLIDDDISYCTHKHVFVDGEDCTLKYNRTEHTLSQFIDECDHTITYMYDTSRCKHTLIYDMDTRTYKHNYDKTKCIHQYVYDLSHCKNTYRYDTLTHSYSVVYNSRYCSHDSTCRHVERRVIDSAFAHYYPNSCGNCNTRYGYNYMCGKMFYKHKCKKSDVYQIKNNYNCHTDSTYDFYSKVLNPVYDSHLIKGKHHYDAWDGFTKVVYGLFDADMISAVNQSEFIIMMNHDYIRFTAHDLNTDVFYSKFIGFNMKLYKAINSDFKHYQATKEFLCDNIFNREKLLLFKQIYEEYICYIDMLKADLLNIKNLTLDEDTSFLALSIENESMISNCSNRFSKLYRDIEKNVLMSVNSDKFDIYYIGLHESLTFFATNYNLVVTQFVDHCKILKVILSINKATLILEDLIETMTLSTIRTLCQANITALATFKVVMNMNMRNIDNLLSKLC